MHQLWWMHHRSSKDSPLLRVFFRRLSSWADLQNLTDSENPHHFKKPYLPRHLRSCLPRLWPWSSWSLRSEVIGTSYPGNKFPLHWLLHQTLYFRKELYLPTPCLLPIQSQNPLLELRSRRSYSPSELSYPHLQSSCLSRWRLSGLSEWMHLFLYYLSHMMPERVS